MPSVYKVPETMSGSLPWEWAEQHLTASHNYFLTTVGANARPHTMIVWGIWLENRYYFSTGETTRKAKNLGGNPNCIVCNESAEEAVIVEGEARTVSPKEVPPSAFELYEKKYGWKLDPKMGPIFRVTPSKVFAMPEQLFPAGATRWIFE